MLKDIQFPELRQNQRSDSQNYLKTVGELLQVTSEKTEKPLQTTNEETAVSQLAASFLDFLLPSGHINVLDCFKAIDCYISSTFLF